MTAVSDTVEIWKAFVFWRFQCVIYENTKLIWLSDTRQADIIMTNPNAESEIGNHILPDYFMKKEIFTASVYPLTDRQIRRKTDNLPFYS